MGGHHARRKPEAITSRRQSRVTRQSTGEIQTGSRRPRLRDNCDPLGGISNRRNGGYRTVSGASRHGVEYAKPREVQARSIGANGHPVQLEEELSRNREDDPNL